MIIKCPNDFSAHNDKWKVFLAGPIQGAPKWQDQLPDLDNVVWISPRRDDGAVLNDETHKQQMEWETQALRSANIILFWIPEEVEHIEGRGYAQTTRFELGENLGRGKRIILGVNDNFPGREYFEYKARKYETIHRTVFKTLDECVNALKIYTSMCEKMPQIYNVNDAEFENRIDYANAECFMEQDDWRKIEKWNTMVNPCDMVYHFGNFGCSWALEYLTGRIMFMQGQGLKL